jgi:hypothetical protein
MELIHALVLRDSGLIEETALFLADDEVLLANKASFSIKGSKSFFKRPLKWKVDTSRISTFTALLHHWQLIQRLLLETSNPRLHFRHLPMRFVLCLPF